jgi:hypothetical protein
MILTGAILALAGKEIPVIIGLVSLSGVCALFLGIVIPVILSEAIIERLHLHKEQNGIKELIFVVLIAVGEGLSILIPIFLATFL